MIFRCRTDKIDYLNILKIGLAVGDIESVQRNARLKREAMQVQLHVDLERKLPRSFVEKASETEYVLDFSQKCSNNGLFRVIFLLHKIKPLSFYLLIDKMFIFRLYFAKLKTILMT
jgi:hypothetical protein